MVRKDDGSDPILDEGSLDLSLINVIIDQMHGDFNAWELMHKNVGWIQIRFPLNIEDNVAAKDFTSHLFDSPVQSVIVLHMIRLVDLGGGYSNNHRPQEFVHISSLCARV